jgi:hypothetical protein
MRLGLRSLQVLQRPRLGIEERWIQVSFFDARRFRGQSRGLTRRPGYAQGSRHVEAQLGLSLLLAPTMNGLAVANEERDPEERHSLRRKA